MYESGVWREIGLVLKISSNDDCVDRRVWSVWSQPAGRKFQGADVGSLSLNEVHQETYWKLKHDFYVVVLRRNPLTSGSLSLCFLKTFNWLNEVHSNVKDNLFHSNFTILNINHTQNMPPQYHQSWCLNNCVPSWHKKLTIKHQPLSTWHPYPFPQT